MEQTDTLQLILDRMAISDLAARFSDAANRRDGAAFRAVWADDAVWTIGPPMNISITGGDKIAETFMSLMEKRWELFIQFPSAAHLIEIEGDSATARLYLSETAQAKDNVGNTNISVYDDTLRRTAEGWRFSARTYKTLYVDETPLKGSMPTRI